MAKKDPFYYLKYLLFLLALYFFIFNPPFSFLPLSPKFGLYILVLPFLAKEKFQKYFGYFIGIFMSLFCIVIFCFLREIELMKFEYFILNSTMFFEYFMIPIVLIRFYESFVKKQQLELEIIKVGVVASIFTILMIFIPALNDFIRYQLLKTDDFTENVAERTYGLAESLTYSYAIVQGIIAVLILFYSKNNKKLLFLLPVFLICILFNARIGFSALIVGVVAYYFYNFKLLNVLITVITIFGVFFVLTETSLFEDQKKTIDWALEFFTQSSDFITGKKSENGNTFDTLFGDMFILPTSENEWLFGKGVNIFGKSYGHSSDVGYILQLYYGGVIYLILLLLFVFALFRCLKNVPKREYILGCSLLVLMLICNVKGNIFIPIGTTRLITLLIMWFVISNKSKLKPKFYNSNVQPRI